MANPTNINDQSASDASKLKSRQANQLGSLTAFSMKMQEKTDKQIKSMEKRIDHLMRMQGLQKTRADYTVKATDKSIAANRQLASSTAKVLNSMNESVKQLAIGTKNITKSTAIGSKDILSQYGKAISDDVYYNKQNMVATSLATASPIFGYFASKFMETDVFKGAADNIKFKLGSAINDAFIVSKGMLNSLSEKVKDMFTRTPKIEYSKQSKRYLGDIRIAAEDVKSEFSNRRKKRNSVSDLAIKDDLKSEISRLKTSGKIKQAQTGGYVKKGGLVNVHTGEVITPIEKLPQITDALNKAKNTLGSESSGALKTVTGLLADNVLRMEDYVAENQKTQRTLVRSFIEGYKTARDPGNKSWQDRMLKATLEMKIAMTGMTSRLLIAWQRVLTEHPFFKNLLGGFELLKTGIFSPMKFLFGMRGGYRRYLPKGMNNFENISQTLNVTFVQQMIRLDKMIFYLKTLADIELDKQKSLKAKNLGKYASLEEKFEKERSEKEFSLFGQIRDFMTKRKKDNTRSWGQKLFSTFAAQLDLDVDTMKESGITGFGGLFNPLNVLRKAKLTPEDIKRQTEDERAAISGLMGRGKEKASGFFGRIRDRFRKAPALAAGGVVAETGIAKVHKDEVIANSTKMSNMAKNFKETSENLIEALKTAKFDTEFKTRAFKKRNIDRYKYRKLTYDVSTFIPRMVIQDIAEISQHWEDDKKRFAIQASLYGLTKGFITGESFIGKDGKFDKTKFDKNYIQPTIKAKKYADEKLKSGIAHAKEKSSEMSDYLMQKTYDSAFDAEFKRRAAQKRLDHKLSRSEKYKTIKGKYINKKQTAKNYMSDMKEKTRIFLGYGLTLEERMQKAQDKHQQRLNAQESKFQKSLQKQQNKYDKRRIKRTTKWGKMFDKHWSYVVDKYKKGMEVVDKGTKKTLEKIKERKEKTFQWFSKFKKTQEQRLQKIKNAGIKAREKIELKLFERSLRTQEKITKKWNNEILKENKKHLKDQEKRTKRTKRLHSVMMWWIARKEKKQIEKMNKFKDKTAKLEKKLKDKKDKVKNKIEKLQLKAQKRKENWENKLKRRQMKYELKAKARVAKVEGKLKWLQEKAKLKRQARFQKIKDKKLREQNKIKEILAKAKMKKQMKKLKEDMKDAKKQAKIDAKKLKQELKEARRQEWQQRKQMMKERWEYFKSAPKRFKEFQKKIDTGLKDRMKVAMKGIKKLDKIRYYNMKMLGVIGKGFKMIKSTLRGTFKWIMLGAGFLKDAIFGSISMLGPMLISGISAITGPIAAALGALGFMGVGSGVIGGVMGYGDAKKAMKKSKEWGTSKAGSAIGGFLGGTDSGMKGAKRGALKGGAIGASIGTLVGGPVGFAIGGAIGVIAGGILGAIGGKNISKAMDFMGAKIKKLVKGIYSFITWPIRMVWKVIKSVYSDYSKAYKKEGILGLTKELMKKTMKVMLFPFYMPLKIANKLADWGAKKLGFEKQWTKIKETIKSIILFPFNYIKDLYLRFAIYIKDSIASFVEKIPIIGKNLSARIRGDKSTIKPEIDLELTRKTSKEKSRLDRASGINKQFDGAGIYEKLTGKTIPHAKIGGYVKKGGLVKVHAGELISPLSPEIKDKIENAMMDGKTISKHSAMNDTKQTRFMLEEQAKYQKNALEDFAKSNNLATSTIINNVTSSMSNSMQSIANSMGGKDKSNYDVLAQQILQGDLS